MSAFILSSLVLATLRLQIQSDQLFYIRTQQVFGLIACVYLYFAVLITPLSGIVNKKNTPIRLLLFSRRSLGVAAAYFTVLHVGFTFIEQIDGYESLAFLPQRFKVAFIVGAFASVVLLLMAATSFDSVIKKMTVRRWKNLHHLVYPSIVFIIIHVWLIGTHARQDSVKFMVVGVLSVLFVLEAIRISKSIAKRYNMLRAERDTLALAIFVLMIGSLMALPLLTPSYHDDHESALTETRQ